MKASILYLTDVEEEDHTRLNQHKETLKSMKKQLNDMKEGTTTTRWPL